MQIFGSFSSNAKRVPPYMLWKFLIVCPSVCAKTKQFYLENLEQKAVNFILQKIKGETMNTI